MRNQRTIKQYAAVWQSILFLIICFSTNCYSESGGELHPQAGKGYSVTTTPDKIEAARIIFGETTVQIHGSWRQGSYGNTFDVENNSPVPFIIDFNQVKTEIYQEAGMTRIDSILDVTNNESYKSKTLYKETWDYDAAKPKSTGDIRVICEPKQKCSFLVNVVFPQTKLDKTKNVEVIFPSVSDKTQETRIIFNCGSSASLPTANS